MGHYRPEGYADEEAIASTPLGWRPLVIDLLPKIDRSKFKVTQVKEKFGGLRVYVDPVNKETTPEDWAQVESAIGEAEHQSFLTCQDCGRPGTIELVRDFWFYTLCPLCYAKKGFSDDR